MLEIEDDDCDVDYEFIMMSPMTLVTQKREKIRTSYLLSQLFGGDPEEWECEPEINKSIYKKRKYIKNKTNKKKLLQQKKYRKNKFNYYEFEEEEQEEQEEKMILEKREVNENESDLIRDKLNSLYI